MPRQAGSRLSCQTLGLIVKIEVRRANPEDAELVAAMAIALTDEISASLREKQFDLEIERTTELCRALLDEGRYVVLLASAGGAAAGFVGISEARALYANGSLATMQEFYVEPSFRSRGVGASLIEAAVRLSTEKRWHRLEVCTPPLPEFERSLAFYESNGFEVTGGRKLRRMT